MKSVSFTEFRKMASGFISEVETGETIILIRHGRPVVEIKPVSKDAAVVPHWKKNFIPLELDGADLSKAILEERETAE